jgi:hypothetical protein
MHFSKKHHSQAYTKHIDWSLRCKSVALHGHPKKDVFPKSKRVTVNEEAIIKDKAKHVPPPGTYDLPS